LRQNHGSAADFSPRRVAGLMAAAIDLITEQGLAFSTCVLARRLSSSHPLLFRYLRA